MAAWRRSIAGDDRSVADLGEWGVIGALAARMPAGPLTSVGIGDDAAVVATPSGNVVAAVDLLLEGRHFLRDWSSAYDIGVKAAARSLADIAAMGARNTALLVGLAAPGTLPARWAAELADGLAFEAGRAGAGVAGGDTARADSVLISVTALGDLQGRGPVLRSGARPGDVVAMAGVLGHSAAGLALLASGLARPADRGNPVGRGGPSHAGPCGALLSPSDAMAAHLRPVPPYDAGPEAAVLGATAMIDVSDGLVADLGHVAKASGVRVEVNSSSLDAWTLAGAATAALAARVEPGPGDARQAGEGPRVAAPGTGRETAESLALRWVLSGGEDHALVATFPPSVPLPKRWQVIGSVRPGSGVTVDGVPYEGAGGWQHFR